MDPSAADRPLSLQAYPSREQAEAGYAREQAAGVPRDAPNRLYRDGWPKPVPGPPPRSESSIPATPAYSPHC